MARLVFDIAGPEVLRRRATLADRPAVFVAVVTLLDKSQ
jgi:hypothetical protein